MSYLAICTVNNYTLPINGQTGYQATSGQTITIALTNPAGVNSGWSINCATTDGYNPGSTVALVEATKIGPTPTYTCQFTCPTQYLGFYGFSLIFSSTINNDPSTTATFLVYLPNLDGTVLFPDQIWKEYNTIYGTVPLLNQLMTQRAQPAVGMLSGDAQGAASNNTVVAIQNNDIQSGLLGSGDNGKVLTWNGGSSQWQPETPSGGSGLDQLTGDVLAGPGTGSQVATMVGIQSNPVANTTPIQSAVPIWDTGSSHYDIRPITQDDIGPGFTITGFTGGSIVEIGATVTNPMFNASYSTPAASANITNTDSIDSPLTLTTPFTSGTVVGSFHHTSAASVTFTLTATAAVTKMATQTIGFEARSFGGVSSAGATSSVTASGNNAVLSTGDTINSLGLHTTDVGNIYGPFTPSAQKIYLLLVGGSHTFKDSNTGFAFAFNAPTAVSFTNQNGSVVSMYLYETTNFLSATFSILVNT